MNQKYRDHSVTDAERNRSFGEMPVLRELEGHMCTNCGSLRYFLVFRTSGDGRSGILAARCTRCREPKEWAPSDIEPECPPELRTD
jgi:hypothetical protein